MKSMTQQSRKRSATLPKPRWSWVRPVRSPVVFDVASTGIRACQLQRHVARVSSCDQLQVDVHEPPPAAGAPAQAPHLPAARLARLIGQGRFHGHDAELVLSSNQLQFQTMQLPPGVMRQPPNLIQEALRWEVARELRREPAELEVRFWRLPSGHRQRHNVMAVSIESRCARQWVDELNREGIHLVRMETAPCALVHLAASTWPPQENDLWGVLDLGHQHTALTAVVGDTPVYIRSVATCMRQWTQRFAEALDVPCEVAEQLRLQIALPAAGSAATPPPAAEASAGAAVDPSLEAVARTENLPGLFADVARDGIETLVRDVQRCFTYVMQSFPDLRITRLVLTGGGSRQPGLVQELGARLNLPVVVLCSEHTRRALPEISFDPRCAAAIGAALATLEAP